MTTIKDKWLKWQLGIGGVAFVFFIFQNVKESPAFAQAHQLAVNAGRTPDMQNFENNQQPSDSHPRLRDHSFNQDGSSFQSGTDPFIGQFNQQGQQFSHSRSGRS